MSFLVDELMEAMDEYRELKKDAAFESERNDAANKGWQPYSKQDELDRADTRIRNAIKGIVVGRVLRFNEEE